MSYQIVYPITMAIDADSFKDAVKQYAKLNYSANIASLVITDRQRYMKANLKYYTEGYKNKVGISLFPTVWPSTNSLFVGPNTWPYTTQVSYDTKEYPKTTFVETPAFVPTIVPINPLGSVFSATTSSPLFSSASPLSPVYPSNWVPNIIPSSWSSWPWPL